MLVSQRLNRSQYYVEEQLHFDIHPDVTSTISIFTISVCICMYYEFGVDDLIDTESNTANDQTDKPIN